MLRVLNGLASLDLLASGGAARSGGAVQELLGGPQSRVEVFHLISFLLSFGTSVWGEGPPAVARATRGLLHEVLLLTGHFARLNAANQDVLQWGRSPTILQKLARVPFAYFSDPSLKPILFGTLVAATFANDRSRALLSSEMSLDLLREYVRGERERHAEAAKAAEGGGARDGGRVGGGGGRFALRARFPVALWPEAEDYYAEG